MAQNVAIIGAGVSGLTCGVVFAEHGDRTVIFAKDIGQQTTSSAAAAGWFPSPVEPAAGVLCPLPCRASGKSDPIGARNLPGALRTRPFSGERCVNYRNAAI